MKGHATDVVSRVAEDEDDKVRVLQRVSPNMHSVLNPPLASASTTANTVLRQVQSQKTSL